MLLCGQEIIRVESVKAALLEWERVCKGKINAVIYVDGQISPWAFYPPIAPDEALSILAPKSPS